MTTHEAYDQGYDAYWEGVDVSDNPYVEEADAAKRIYVSRGWRDGTATMRSKRSHPRVIFLTN